MGGGGNALFTLGSALGGVGLQLGRVLLELGKSLWYISLLGSSFVNINVHHADLDQITKSFSSSIKAFEHGVKTLLKWFHILFEYTDFNKWTGSATGWNCKGFLSLAAWGLMIFLCFVLFVIVGKDTLFYVTISSQAKMEKMAGAKKALFNAVVQLGLFFGIYVLQIILLFMYRIMIMILGMSTTYTSSSCGEIDNIIMGFTKYLVIATMIIMLFWYFMLFSGRPITKGFYKGLGKFLVFLAFLPITIPLYFLKPGFRDWMNDENTKEAKSMNPKEMIDMMRKSAQRIVQLTFGIWTVGSAADYGIVDKAQDFGKNSKKNQQEAVIVLTAKSRGMLWIFVPGCMYLTKIAELCNSPPVLVDPRTGLVFDIHIAFRAFKWMGNVSRLVTSVLLVLMPSYNIVIAFLCSFLPGLIVDIGKAVYDTLMESSDPNQVVPVDPDGNNREMVQAQPSQVVVNIHDK